MTEYRVPKTLSDFQRKMYMHLIDWKRRHITEEAGQYAERDYDTVLPEAYKGTMPHLYEPIRQRFLDHQKQFPFKTHKFADHMASSQVACANLFLPIMADPERAPYILAAVKPDLAGIATEELNHGFRIEFWDEDPNGPADQAGMLGDHNKSTGTDADLAIAYRNHDGQLCLWLIEHKLTENEFTTCGGAKSNGRKLGNYRCDSTVAILANPDLCYYHGKCKYNYWPITLANESIFPRDNLLSHAGCPFKGGMNQLWRNQLLAIAVEKSKQWPYQEVHFSVVRHPRNRALDATIENFIELTEAHGRFFAFTPEPIIDAAERAGNPALRRWAWWYRDLYAIGAD